MVSFKYAQNAVQRSIDPSVATLIFNATKWHVKFAALNGAGTARQLSQKAMVGSATHSAVTSRRTPSSATDVALSL